jgi:hypothetical protein
VIERGPHSPAYHRIPLPTEQKRLFSHTHAVLGILPPGYAIAGFDHPNG